MKRKIYSLAICLLVIGASSFAQQWVGNINPTDAISRDGNVGIGAGTNPPTAKLDVNCFNAAGAVPQYGLLLRTNSFYTGTNADNSYFLKTLDMGNGFVHFIVTGSGRVGIGTSSPTSTLDVRGDVYTNGSVYVDGGDVILSRTTNPYGYVSRPNVSGFKNLAFGVTGGGNLDNLQVFSNLSVFNGNVGIGTASPGSFKLAVEGKIGAREIQVTLQNPFPDYVFGSDYKLRSLSSLEQYINQNKHLPGVPSADEVEKNGGVELGKLNTKLLEKVEELTLYVIELKKENQQMKKEIKKLSRRK
jgi:hypothetical protein